jgi:hypothetical protein
MQGLWKEKLSGFNNKDTKRKKQSFKHFCKDKLKGNFTKNDIEFTVNNKKKLTNSQYKSNPIITQETIEILEVFKIEFERTIKLSKRFIRKNCLNCEFNIKHKEEFNEKRIKEIKEMNTTAEHRIALYTMLRYKKWCNLDIYSDHVSFHKEYNAKTWFFDKYNIGCFRKLENIELSTETKIYNVILYQGSYYIDKNNSLYPLSNEWTKIREIKKLDKTINLVKNIKTYEDDNTVRLGKYLYKNRSLEYKYIKQLEHYYDSGEDIAYDCVSIRRNNKRICCEIKKDRDFDVESLFKDRRKMFIDYYW